jgi:hypothetical protein
VSSPPVALYTANGVVSAREVTTRVSPARSEIALEAFLSFLIDIGM